MALTAPADVSGDENLRRSARAIPGRYIIVLESGTDSTAVATSVQKLKGARIRHTYHRGVKGFAVDVSAADAQTLARDSRVQFVEEDSTISIATTTWGLDRIDQRALPLNGSYVRGGTGAGVAVYVVDTGILAEHAEFGGRVEAGFNAFSDGRDASDCHGHGTHVAGVVGGSTFGVASSATLVPVRVLDCSGVGSISTLLAGLDWILEEQARSPRPAVVNFSLGGDASSALDAAVGELIAAGLTTVIAAGNSNQDACRTSPARVSTAITVGASTEVDQRAPFSNYGACVDLFAPGANILSSTHATPTATAVGSGTSAAAPFVSGVAALWLEQYPNSSPGTVSRTVLSQATVDALAGVGQNSPNRLVFSLVGSLDDSAEGDAQLLADPSFEYGTTFWSSDVCTVINPAGCMDMLDVFGVRSVPSRSGSGHAAIGGPARSFHVSSERVTIPAAIERAELSVYLWVGTKNKIPEAKDVLTIEIRDGAGELLETLGTFSNLDAGPTWEKRSFDVTRYRGQTVRISFTGVQSQGPPTWFLLDDAALKIWH